jgi:hypothetical protein
LQTLALVLLRFRTIASHLGQSLTPAEAVARMAEAPAAGDALAIARQPLQSISQDFPERTLKHKVRRVRDYA